MLTDGQRTDGRTDGRTHLKHNVSGLESSAMAKKH